MKNNNEEDKSSHFSSAKTSSSFTEEDKDLFPKSRPRGGIKSKLNNFQPGPGRHTIAVPLNSFSGISHNASFQSKLLFFNAGKPRPKFQNIPIAHEKVITEEKENNMRKTMLNKDDIFQKNKNDKIDLDNNININKIVESKNNNNNNNKINNNDNDIKKKNFYKKRSVNITANQLYLLNLEAETSTDKKQAPLNIKLKSLKDQWYYQKILLDYNILDFTSKYIIILYLIIIFNFSDIRNVPNFK